MRRLLLAGFVLLLLVGPLAAPVTANSELPEGGDLTLEIPPIEDPVKPVSGNATTRFTVEADCASFGNASTVPVRVHVTRKPVWAVVTLVPATVVLHPDCEHAPRARATGIVRVSTTADAPAFQPQNVILRTHVQSDGADVRGATGSVRVVADYFGVLEANSPTEALNLSPGAAETQPVHVRNLGNDVTRVTLRVVGAPEGWNVTVPKAFVLGARQTGNRTISDTVDVHVRAPRTPSEGVAHGNVTLDLVGVHAHWNLRGDAVRWTLPVNLDLLEPDPAENGTRANTTDEGAPQGAPARDTPAWGAAAAVALAVAARRRP